MCVQCLGRDLALISRYDPLLFVCTCCWRAGREVCSLPLCREV